MDHAKQQHEKLPAIIDAAEFRTDGFRPAGHQENARAEQHRKYAQEFLINKNVCKKPGAKIKRICATHEQRVGVGREGHSERVNVHDQDAEDRHTTKYVEAADTVGAGHGRRSGRCVRRVAHNGLWVLFASSTFE